MAATRRTRSTDTVRPEGKPAKAPQPESSPPHAANAASVRVLKKYPNRRLYDTRISGYITLADVKRMVLNAEPFEVRDAKTSEDITRSILLQIILEEESGGVPMFSTPTLAHIIRFYGHAMQGMMGAYLEKNLQGFADIQEQFAEQSRGLYGVSSFNPDAWTQFMAGQAPMMQGLMGNYLEQSTRMFVRMQEQMNEAADQAKTMFTGRSPGSTSSKS